MVVVVVVMERVVVVVVVMDRVLDDMHTVLDIDPDVVENISALLACEWTQAAPQSVWLNDTALENMLSMLVTLETSHLEMSMLNKFANMNVRLMSVTLDTSHLEMSRLNA